MKLKNNAGKIINLEKESTTYVGLPLTLKGEKELEFVKNKIYKNLELTKELWNTQAPLQAKYHLQRLCVNTELDYVLKATKWKENYKGSWLKDIQNQFDQTWKEITDIVPKKFLYLPVKYYGAGMLNIKDRWKTARLLYEARNNGNNNDVTCEYYKRKYDKWIKKGLVPQMDIEKIPTRANVSISAPPDSNQHRLEDSAFRMMLALRYNSKSLDKEYGVPETIGVRTCAYHPEEELTLQHIISCPYLMNRYAIEQHNRIAQFVKCIIKRNSGVSYADREKYTDEQLIQKMNNKDVHRPDVIYVEKGISHTVDIIVTSSNNDKRGNNVTRAWGVKTREYKNERNLHIVLLDTAGNMAEESWNFLTGFGINTRDLRTIQRIIYECTDRKIEAIVDQAKYSRNGDILGVDK